MVKLKYGLRSVMWELEIRRLFFKYVLFSQKVLSGTELSEFIKYWRVMRNMRLLYLRADKVRNL